MHGRRLASGTLASHWKAPHDDTASILVKDIVRRSQEVRLELRKLGADFFPGKLGIANENAFPDPSSVRQKVLQEGQRKKGRKRENAPTGIPHHGAMTYRLA